MIITVYLLSTYFKVYFYNLKQVSIDVVNLSWVVAVKKDKYAFIN